MTRLVIFDLDGTLLNSSGEVTDYTRKVLSEASDRGVVVIPATGSRRTVISSATASPN